MGCKTLKGCLLLCQNQQISKNIHTIPHQGILLTTLKPSNHARACSAACIWLFSPNDAHRLYKVVTVLLSRSHLSFSIHQRKRIYHHQCNMETYEDRGAVTLDEGRGVGCCKGGRVWKTEAGWGPEAGDRW